MIARAARLWLIALVIVVGPAPIRADASSARADAVRGGVSFHLRARLSGAALRLQIWAESIDGVVHSLAADPVDLWGTVDCTAGKNGSGHGWGSGSGGSDGWSTAIKISPGKPTLVYDQLELKDVLPFHRGCLATIELRVRLIDGADVTSSMIGEVGWTRPHRGVDRVDVRSPR